MEILEPIKEHNVTDYDFMFNSGSKLAITIDHDIGDHVEELVDRYVVNTVARPSVMNPDEATDAETVEVFKTHLAFLAKCNRKQAMPSKEDLFNMHETIKKLSTTVQ